MANGGRATKPWQRPRRTLQNHVVSLWQAWVWWETQSLPGPDCMHDISIWTTSLYYEVYFAFMILVNAKLIHVCLGKVRLDYDLCYLSCSTCLYLVWGFPYPIFYVLLFCLMIFFSQQNSIISWVMVVQVMCKKFETH